MNKFVFIFLFLFFISCNQNRSKGKLAYEVHCANCHGKNGEGLVTLYPPLKQERINDLRNQIPCMIQNGIAPGDQFYSENYPFPMPPNPQLSSTDLLNISNYVLNHFGKQNQIISPQEINEFLEKCE